MNTSQQENIAIKKALRKEFPTYKISVRQSIGTASGWKNISIETDIVEERKPEEFGFGTRLVKEVRDRFEVIEKRAGEIVRENAKLYTYCSDDGYDTNRECLLIDVKGTAK
jgi:hypothetical protein